jgi:hypothetical protein
MGKKTKQEEPVPYEPGIGSDLHVTAVTAANYAAQTGKSMQVACGNEKVTVQPGNLPAEVERKLREAQQKLS